MTRVARIVTPVLIALACALPTSVALGQPRAVAQQSSLDPAGPAAREIDRLWEIMLWTSTVVTLIVVAAIVFALFRPRGAGFIPEADRPADPRGELENDESAGRGKQDQGRPSSERTGTRWMVITGIIVPTIILTGLLVYTLATLGALSPRSDDASTLTVEVTGHQWWWSVRYLSAEPSQMAVTANEIRIPVGQRVRVLLRAEDVIHSFWVPGLQGKADMVPGRTNVTWIQADAPGTWRGQCAEYCGMQHAKMALVVVAQAPDEFARWLALQREPAPVPSEAGGLADRETFLQSGCVFCHTVRGTLAHGTAGPDLTHLATRLTLAAGELPNTPGNLYGWIANPQALKPGTKMPAVPLEAEELHAIVRYLQTLR